MALVEVRDLHKIFGPNPKKAIPLIKKGLTKQEILKKTGCTVAINGASFSIEKRRLSLLWGFPEVENRRSSGVSTD